MESQDCIAVQMYLILSFLCAHISTKSKSLRSSKYGTIPERSRNSYREVWEKLCPSLGADIYSILASKLIMRQVILTPGEDGYWVVEVPSLPDCICQGKTREEALMNIKECI